MVPIKAANIARKLSDVFELPKEIVLNLPLITLVGNEDLTIENYKGVLEYSEEKIRINTTAGVIRVEGRKLALKRISRESVSISGVIIKLEYFV